MRFSSTRLDRFISAHSDINRRDVRLAIAKKRILIDGQFAKDINQVIGPFTHITLDTKILQSRTPTYIMMNKPKGVVSATVDNKHSTVLDVLANQTISSPAKSRAPIFNTIAVDDLHISGRLDLNSSGLLLLTNDGQWSRRLSSPEKNIPKRYQVTVEDPLNETYIDAFAKGMYFSYESIMTRPATLKIITPTMAEVSIVEGRYHQIKRMFGHFRNKVLSLHRLSVGDLLLDDSLSPGESRFLSPAEINYFNTAPQSNRTIL